MNGLNLVVHMCVCVCDVTASKAINADVNVISRHMYFNSTMYTNG